MNNPLQYSDVLEWLKVQPPEALDQLIVDLQKAWSIPANLKFEIQLSQVGPNIIGAIKEIGRAHV